MADWRRIVMVRGIIGRGRWGKSVKIIYSDNVGHIVIVSG